MFWYTSIFGDNWKLITDILNYHPLIRGRLREVKECSDGFVKLNEKLNRVVHNKIKMAPYKSD